MAYTTNLLTRYHLIFRSEEGLGTVYLYASSYLAWEGGGQLPDYALYELEDGSDSKKWISEEKSSEGTEWLAAHFSTRQRIRKVAFFFSWEQYYASDVTLQGSNDSTDGSNGTWTTIAADLDNTPAGGDPFAYWTVEHEVSNASWYTWYRIVFPNKPGGDPVWYHTASITGWMLYGIEGDEYFEETPSYVIPIIECIRSDMLRLKLDIYNPMNVAQQVRIELMENPPAFWPVMSLTKSLPLTTDILVSYPFGGDYPISATLLNYDGTEEVPFLPGVVRVYDIPQIENPQASPTEGYGPTTVQLSWEPYEPGAVREYEIDDDAGNIMVIDGSATTATLTYQTAGTYTPRIRARMLNGKVAMVQEEVVVSTPRTFYVNDAEGNGADVWLDHGNIKPGTLTLSIPVPADAIWTLDHSKGLLHTETDVAGSFQVTISGYTYYALTGDPSGWVAFPAITVHAAPGDLQWLYLTPSVGTGTSAINQTVTWGIIPTSAVADIVTGFVIDWDDGSEPETASNAVVSATHTYAVGDVLEHVVRHDLGFTIIPRIRWVATVDEVEITGDWFDGTAFYIAPAKPTISEVVPSEAAYIVPKLPLSLAVTILDPDDIAERISIAWGDGVVTEASIPSTLTVTATHQYAGTGTYTITISAITEHYAVPDSSMMVMVVSDLFTEGLTKAMDGLTAVLTHVTEPALDGIERTIQIEWGDE